jgi:hypothetical protein
MINYHASAIVIVKVFVFERRVNKQRSRQSCKLTLFEMAGCVEQHKVRDRFRRSET